MFSFKKLQSNFVFYLSTSILDFNKQHDCIYYNYKIL